MNILISILLVVVGLIIILLVIAFFVKKEYYIEREIIINAPLPKVFEYLKLIRNWDNFNKRSTADAEKKTVFKGTDGTVGFIYGWSGNKKVGEGEKEIKFISDSNKIETEIRFIKPFAAVGYTNMSTEAVSPGRTKVISSNRSKIKYPFNILLLMVEKVIAKDMDLSLLTLKSILEKA